MSIFKKSENCMTRKRLNPPYGVNKKRFPFVVKPVRAVLALSAAIALFTLTSGCRQEEQAMPTPGNPFLISVSLSTNTMHIGDRLHVTVDAIHPADTDPALPSPANGKVIVVRNMQERTEPFEQDEAYSRTVFDCSLTSFRPGTHLIWTQAMQFAQSNGKFVSKILPDTRITVESILTDKDTQLRPMKSNTNWIKTTSIWVYAVLTAILFAILAMLYLVKRKVGRPETIPTAPPVPPDIAALTALERLLEQRLIEEHRIEAFYVAVSDIVRTYLEDRFQLRAPEQTTEEFIYEAVHSRLLSMDHQQLLRSFLEQCDLVKFARHEPEEQDMRNAHDAAKRFVVDTRPHAEAEEVQS